jgi:pyruvate kinase
MLRRTKILATLGPATDKPGVLENILETGVNVVRINFSHGNEEEHIGRVERVRQWAKQNNTYIGVLMDLQGPKIRIANFKDGAKIALNVGDTFALDADLGDNDGDQHAVGIAYKKLPQDVKVGDTLLLDDGRTVMDVVSVEGGRINCVITQAGVLSDRKGINLRGGGLSADALTEKDKKDILIAAKANADYVAVSFPISGDDIRYAKQLLTDAGSDAGIISKIERAEALEHDTIIDIIEESAGVMVARGDLGVEIGDPLLPAQQKRLIKLARSNDKVVITATQMLESMIESPIPTRAEVFDVANAVLDGTDCIMLSAETAAGKFPANAVKTMVDVCLETEKNPTAKRSHHRLHEDFEAIDEAIAMSAMYAANHCGAKAIATITESGKTALLASRISSNLPIFAMSDKAPTLQKATLYRGTYPCHIDKSLDKDWDEVNKKAVENIVARFGDNIKQDDLIVITKGMSKEDKGGTNTMKIVKVGAGNY